MKNLKKRLIVAIAVLAIGAFGFKAGSLTDVTVSGDPGGGIKVSQNDPGGGI